MDEIKLLTFNVWGLKYVSKLRRERINGIVEKLQDASENYDIVALQEVWVEEDWRLFDETLKHLYPYRRWFKSGIIAGPGLAILSKIPIMETFLYRFPINGRSSAVNRGDFYVGKSILITKLSNNLVIFNSHMHAPYSLTGDDAYTAHRSVQAWDFCRLINMYKQMGCNIVVVGDLNSKPGSLPHKLLTNDAELRDSWEVLKYNRNESLISLHELSNLSPKDQIIIGGVTCDSQLNSWRKDRKLHEACRLDYCLISDNIDVIDASVKFVDNLPNFHCSYSDHFAYHVKFKLVKGNNTPITDTINKLSIEKFEIYKELISEIDHYVNITIPKYYDWRKYYFFGCIISILLIILLNPLSSSLSILFSIISPILSITGVINGLIWFVSGNYEIRNFEEVKLQVLDMMNGGSLI